MTYLKQLAYDLRQRWPLVTRRTLERHERNAFQLGVDAGRAAGDRPVKVWLESGPC